MAAEAAYELPEPLDTPEAVTRAALEVERRCEATYAWTVEQTSGAGRRLAVTALTRTAVRALAFRGSPEIFPGLRAVARTARAGNPCPAVERAVPRGAGRWLCTRLHHRRSGRDVWILTFSHCTFVQFHPGMPRARGPDRGPEVACWWCWRVGDRRSAAVGRPQVVHPGALTRGELGVAGVVAVVHVVVDRVEARQRAGVTTGGRPSVGLLWAGVSETSSFSAVQPPWNVW